ncbi:MAG: ester cyclase, partial [Acetobacteraceae bacterium]
AATPGSERFALASPTRLDGQLPRVKLPAAERGPEAWARDLFDDLWNRRRLDRVTAAYTTDVICHAGGGRRLVGVRNVQGLILAVLAAVPDGLMSVEHVCWSEEGDGVIVAVRWRLEGRSKPGGILGDCPAGLPTVVAGISHLRLAHGGIVEEWMMFDELGALVSALRA